MIDHVDEMAIVEFGEEVGFDLIRCFFAGSGEIDLEGIEFVIFTTEVDTSMSGCVLGLSSLAEEEVNLVLVCVLLCFHKIKMII